MKSDGSCRSAGSLKVACDAFHTIFYYRHFILVLCYKRKGAWTFFSDTKLFGSKCQKALISWGLESTGVSQRNDAVNSSHPDVSLHTAVSLPLAVPLIYLVKENGRHHWRCNCLSASLLVSITKQSGEFHIVLLIEVRFWTRGKSSRSTCFPNW